MAKIKWMTEVPDRCDHPEDMMSSICFDLLDQPYRRCNKCRMEFCGRDALQHLDKMRTQGKLK